MPLFSKSRVGIDMKNVKTSLGPRDVAALEFAKDHATAQFSPDCILRDEHAFKCGAEWQATQLLPIIAKLADDYKKLHTAIEDAVGGLEGSPTIWKGSEVHRRLKAALESK